MKWNSKIIRKIIFYFGFWVDRGEFLSLNKKIEKRVDDECLSQLRNIYGTSPNILSLRFFYVEEHMFICELLPIKITIKTTRGSWKILIDSTFIVIE